MGPNENVRDWSGGDCNAPNFDQCACLLSLTSALYWATWLVILRYKNFKRDIEYTSCVLRQNTKTTQNPLPSTPLISSRIEKLLFSLCLLFGCHRSNSYPITNKLIYKIKAPKFHFHLSLYIKQLRKEEKYVISNLTQLDMVQKLFEHKWVVISITLTKSLTSWRVRSLLFSSTI